MNVKFTKDDLVAFSRVWKSLPSETQYRLYKIGLSSASEQEKQREYLRCVRFAASIGNINVEKVSMVELDDAVTELEVDNFLEWPNEDDELTQHRRHVGHRIQQIRNHKRISQTKLARRIGSNQGHVSRIEAGKQCITYKTIANIAEALGVAIYDLDCTFDDVGQRVQSLRLSKDIGIGELSSLAGIRLGRISQIENGAGPTVSDGEISSLAKALEAKEDDLDPTYEVRRARRKRAEGQRDKARRSIGDAGLS